MIVNAATVALVKSFEGCVLHAYPDPATHGAPYTVGWGHTSAAGPPAVTPGLTITQAEADAILQTDLDHVADQVFKCLTIPVTPNQLGALTSFTFNLGIGNLKSSTLLKKVNAGDFQGAAKQFLVWNRGNGRVMAGLTRRRTAEAKLFSTP